MKICCFDLDDTLYAERDYLHSALRAIARRATELASRPSDCAETAYQAMLKAYRAKKNTFEALNAYLQVDFPLDCYLNWYRCHRPNITLAPEVVSVLQQLQEKGYTLGLITDGRSRQQRHKIEALGLYRFIEPAHIIISEEFGHEKPCRANYRYFMELYQHAERDVYVGDKPQQELVSPQ